MNLGAKLKEFMAKMTSFGFKPDKYYQMTQTSRRWFQKCCIFRPHKNYIDYTKRSWQFCVIPHLIKAYHNGERRFCRMLPLKGAQNDYCVKVILTSSSPFY